MDTLLLFQLPDALDRKPSKAKPADIKINRVNRELAKRRYYLHKQLTEEFELNAAKRIIKAPYQSFEEIPIGQRYYIGQLLALDYKIQYEINLK
ncbi:hypothetical protein [Mucilaginibacter sp.]